MAILQNSLLWAEVKVVSRVRVSLYLPVGCHRWCFFAIKC